jgi:hypothetical protein
MSRHAINLLLGLSCVATTAHAAPAPTTEVIRIRNRAQTLHLYGPRSGPPVIVSSGDGGWVHPWAPDRSGSGNSGRATGLGY